MTIETKYNVGDVVFYLFGSKSKQNAINSIKVNHEYSVGSGTQIRYRVEGNSENSLKDQVWLHEHQLFATKEELL